MEVVSDWWKGDRETALDIHRSLKAKENKLPEFFGQSPQIGSRRYLVDWLAIICDAYDICATARHLAVLLMDYFMDKFDIEDPHLRIVALGCLLIACKFEEIETKIPKAQKLNEQHASNCGYTIWQYLQMELSLLEFFQWNIAFPTAAHFVDYFLTMAVTESDLHGDQPIIEYNKTKNYMAKYVNYFLEICLQDHAYRDYKPTLICAACIASSRMCLHIKPVWSVELQKVTWYSWKELQPVVQMMLKTHERDADQASPGKCGDCSMSSLSPGSNPSTGSAPPTPTTPCLQDPLVTTMYYNIIPPASFCGVYNITPMEYSSDSLHSSTGSI